MTRVQNPNLEILALAVNQLGELADDMVFLGGCATGLLISDPAAPPIRVTRDVDAIVQVLSRAEYYNLSEKLREHGFKEDTSEDAPICRWLGGEIILDVMPTNEEILGFGNIWYQKAIEYEFLVQLPDAKNIRIVSPPYFLITKLEAFKGRGNGDYTLSHDIEDIVAVLDGRPEILGEIEIADAVLVRELAYRFQELLKDQKFLDAISGHMPTDETSQARVSGILGTINRISEL
jgi:predicted nucleotidyltransferase